MHKTVISTPAKRGSFKREPETERTIAALLMARPRPAASVRFARLFRPVDKSENIKSVQTRNGRKNASNSHAFECTRRRAKKTTRAVGTAATMVCKIQAKTMIVNVPMRVVLTAVASGTSNQSSMIRAGVGRVALFRLYGFSCLLKQGANPENQSKQMRNPAVMSDKLPKKPPMFAWIVGPSKKSQRILLRSRVTV